MSNGKNIIDNNQIFIRQLPVSLAIISFTICLFQALDEITNITGRLVIVDSPDPNFTNLDMFRRLEVVKGHTTNKRGRNMIQTLPTLTCPGDLKLSRVIQLINEVGICLIADLKLLRVIQTINEAGICLIASAM